MLGVGLEAPERHHQDTMGNLEMKYYAIVGGFSKKVIGVCTSVGLKETKDENPRCQLMEIPKDLFNQYGIDDFDQQVYKIYPFLRPNRHHELLTEFTKYCKEHPQERFWQALRNWSGAFKVIIEIPDGNYQNPHQVDTFNFEYKLD